MIERRAHSRHYFEFLVLEHRPAEAEHPQATRMLECLDFSKGGMKLRGQPRYQRCSLTIALPNSERKVTTEVELVHESSSGFGVKFISPSDELLSLISWWGPSRDQSSGSDA